MEAVVTGATGLVGWHLCDILIKEGFEVTALGRNQSKLAELEKMGCSTVKADISKPLPKFPDGVYWFHTAAAVSGATKDVLHAVNIRGTENVLHAARRAKHLVHVSTIAVYGIPRAELFTENQLCNPYTEYGKSKLRAEQLVASSGLPHTVVRPPFIGGPHDNNFLVEIASRLKNRNMPLITKNGTIGYVDARDLANIMTLATGTESMHNDTFNVQGDEVGFHEAVRKIANAVGAPFPKFKMPYPLALAAGTANELLIRIRGKNPDRSLSRYRVKTLAARRSLDTTKLISILKVPFISFAQSVEDWKSTVEELDI